MKPKHILRRLALAALLLVASRFQFTIARAQNTTFTYQGRILDNGANFSGAGLFKFALVTSSNANLTATAIANAPSGGFITGYVVTSGGNGYVTAPAVTVFGGGGSNATAHANISGGVVTNLTVDNPGNGGYSNAPTVLIGPPPANLSYVTYWSNDGTSVNGSEPSAAVSVNVSNGLFTVVLGDTTVPNMEGINASLFAQPNLQLLIWFNDGVHGSVALNPAQNLTPVPYSVAASNVNAANITSGTLSDALLSSNVPRLNAVQTFTGVNTFSNNASITGTLSVSTIAPASTLSVGGDMLISGGYHHFGMDGGNSTGFLYGSYPAFGDGIHLGYNYYADASGTGHIINSGGGTSRISVGYGSIALLVGGTDVAPNTLGLFVNSSGFVGIGNVAPNFALDVPTGVVNAETHHWGPPLQGWASFLSGSNLLFRYDVTLSGAEIAPDGSYHVFSDVRLKRDIAALGNVLERVLQLRPVSYHFRTAPNAPLSLGLIAQEVQPLFPEVVGDGANGMKTIAYSELVPVTVAAIQELNQKLETQLKAQDATITALQKQSAEIASELAEQKKANAQLEARFEQLAKTFARATEKSENPIVSNSTPAQNR